MKTLKDIIINEQRFGYTFQNALICAIKALNDDKQGKDIIEKWFTDEDSIRSLRMFLFRIGHDPKSTSAEDLYAAIKSISMDDKYNLK